MEQLPNDARAEQRLLADISHYCGLAHEANGSYLGAMLAAADFIVRQFKVTYEEATSFVKSSGFFDEQDAASVIYEKSALAPLLLTGDLIEIQAMLQIGFHDGDQTDSLNRWYSNLASTALGMAGPGGHSVENCCTDSATNSPWQHDGACITSDDCVFRITRQFLLEPALQPNLATITDEADALLQHIIVDAKLTAAVDCEFITSEQKEALDATYVECVSAWGKE